MKLKNKALTHAVKLALTATTAGLFISGTALAADEQTETTKVNKNVEKLL